MLPEGSVRLADLVAELDSALAQVTASAEQRQAERNLLLRHWLDLGPEALFLVPGFKPAEAQVNALRQALHQRCQARTPIQHLTGEGWFYGRPFRVTPDVLIPRPETEGLIDAALVLCRADASIRNVLDVGTGSGCIAITLACEQPSLAVTATDISAAALAIATENAETQATRIRFLVGAWLAPVIGETFDLIVSNPPYIPEADADTLTPEVLHEPHQALFAPQSYTHVYETLMTQARACLRPGGHLLLEIGQGQSDTLLAMAQRLDYTGTAQADYAGIPRILTLQR